MKRFLVILVTLLFSKAALAEHITGGEMFYTLDSVRNGVYYYKITLKLYRDCFSAGAQLDPTAAIAVFNKSNNAMVSRATASMSGGVQTLQLSTPGPCITNAPAVCYQVGYYIFRLQLPASANGYTVSYQRCCRIQGISNLLGSGNQGATYTADIPGNSLVANGPENNSARFTGIDTVIVCGGYPFTYNFGAVDPDASDQLRYSFCEAWVGGSSAQGASAPDPPAPPPYGSVNYSSSFSGDAPLGSSVTIDPNTGVITGTAPAEGIYVVTVCVQEIRNGIVIATQRKDLQIKAGGCDLAEAQLAPKYITCDGLSFSFTHATNTLIKSYYWEFGDPATGLNDTSSLQNPTHIFSAPGDYTIKLVTNRNGDCSDSTTAIVSVWPGFFADFSSTGVCLTNPVLFNDATTTNYGVVDSWSWDLADGPAALSTQQDPSWMYSSTGSKTVKLTVTNSKGCVDTISKTINIIDKPPITLAFADTLICVPDAIQLQASGSGNFSWSPVANMVNENTGTPTVNPTTTTTYHVELNQEGCINTDSVKVRVVTFVTLNEMPDTTICATDAAQLHIISDGLQYQWTPADAVDDPTIPNPIAIGGTTTTYTIVASIGSCNTSRDIHVTAIPYPVVNAGPDTIICYNTPAFLHGTHNGSSFTWSPANSLVNPGTLSPTAYPPRDGLTNYVLSSMDTRGCPKSGRDTVGVTVLPRIRPFAGNDTLVIINQPLQLNAEGGTQYIWKPATGLNNPSIKNPVGTYGSEIDSITYIVEVYNDAGCFDTASVKVTVFKTIPYVFVPTGFTPNGDGLNDVIRPVAVGITKINYFRIFNRWGQMVFNTTTNGQGWDGTINGSPQGSNVFVWMVSAIDYLGQPLFLKGTVTLIR